MKLGFSESEPTVTCQLCEKSFPDGPKAHKRNASEGDPGSMESVKDGSSAVVEEIKRRKIS
jgi:hypothetical protein